MHAGGSHVVVAAEYVVEPDAGARSTWKVEPAEARRAECRREQLVAPLEAVEVLLGEPPVEARARHAKGVRVVGQQNAAVGVRHLLGAKEDPHHRAFGRVAVSQGRVGDGHVVDIPDHLPEVFGEVVGPPSSLEVAGEMLVRDGPRRVQRLDESLVEASRLAERDNGVVHALASQHVAAKPQRTGEATRADPVGAIEGGGKRIGGWQQQGACDVGVLHEIAANHVAPVAESLGVGGGGRRQQDPRVLDATRGEHVGAGDDPEFAARQRGEANAVDPAAFGVRLDGDGVRVEDQLDPAIGDDRVPIDDSETGGGSSREA